METSEEEETTVSTRVGTAEETPFGASPTIKGITAAITATAPGTQATATAANTVAEATATTQEGGVATEVVATRATTAAAAARRRKNRIFATRDCNTGRNLLCYITTC